jgi:hypothetical protein
MRNSLYVIGTKQQVKISSFVFFILNPTIMEHFNSLSLGDKRKFLWDQGKYVLTTDFYGSRVKLFSLYTSFVEVYYHPVEKKVMRISIAGDPELKKHLAGIKVSLG